ncbi:MAG TPA: UDP-N-acetylglucosamine 2-epimerase (non-hydrolyzing) [Longimicrobiales bacterium]
MKVFNVAGTRPNLVKMAPLMQALRAAPGIEPVLVHTGQHYDERLSEVFFRELEIPEPDHDLGVGSGSHARQTAEIMTRLDALFEQERPDLVVVVGDVNSTLAAALVAAKLGIPIAHVEAGLRSFDRRMPEEVNRVLTDAVSDFLFTTERAAEENLRREGIAPEKVHFVGNVMIDTLLRHRERAQALDMPGRVGERAGAYGVVTLHRPSNVDAPEVLGGLIDALAEVQRRIPLLFPVHPRTRRRLAEAGLEARIASLGGLRLMEPLGYLEFLGLVAGARVVLTDSGGIQEETTVLGIPCLTLRENTERPVTVTQGTNRLVGMAPARIVEAAFEALEAPPPNGRRPELWDGHAADRVVATLRSRWTGAGWR